MQERRHAQHAELSCSAPFPRSLKLGALTSRSAARSSLMLLSLSAFVRTLSVTLAAAVGGALYDRAVMIGGTQRRTTNEGQEGSQRRPSTPCFFAFWFQQLDLFCCACILLRRTDIRASDPAYSGFDGYISRARLPVSSLAKATSSLREAQCFTRRSLEHLLII